MKNIKKKIVIIAVAHLVGFVVLNFAFPGAVYHSVMGLERFSAGLSLKTVQVDDHKIDYIEGGEGETILLVHGFTGDKDNWTRFAKYLTNKYHVIALDLPGFGDSTQDFKKSYSIEKQAERIHNFVKKIGLKKFHIAGNSMGGAISAAYAYLYPDDLLTLALLDAAGVHSPNDSEFFKMLKMGENVLVVEKPEDNIKKMDFVFVNKPFMTSSIERYLGAKQMENRKFNDKVFKDISLEIDFDNKIKKIKARTLIIWGDTDRVLDISMADVFNESIKNSEKLILKDCGHIPMIEQPKETAIGYLKFLSK